MEKQLKTEVKDKQVITAEQKKQAQVIGNMVNIPGMFVFKWDANKRLSLETIEKVTLVPGVFEMSSAAGSGTIRYRVDIEPGFMYVQAINKKNALRKFKKAIDQYIKRK